MCGLFGFNNYGQMKIVGVTKLTAALAEEAAARGTDACGIAFSKNGHINIEKAGKSAYQMNFKHPEDIDALIGHTRHSTQGSEKINKNNHPFHGHCKNTDFALAHNGVLFNDKTLKRTLSLPKTKIETDSYVAVQLLEKKKKLNFSALKYMAETVEGSFSFSVLDDSGDIYLVKGDSPLSILHFPRIKMYIYASTDDILWKAIVVSDRLREELMKGHVEKVEIKEGDILKLCADGHIEKDSFSYQYYYGKSWCDYGSYVYPGKKKEKSDAETEYIEYLSLVAMEMGFEPELVDELLTEGWTFDEIEDLIYEGEYAPRISTGEAV